MAKRQTLHSAIRKMADGSKQGFSDFYSGTVQFVYRSAFLLFHDHENACRFMVDFYQYLYLHLPEYEKSVSLEKWISKLMLDRYNELSIGKQMPKQDVSSQLRASTSELSSREQERIYRQLQTRIHFPKEPFHFPWKLLLVILPILLLLILITAHYAADIKEYFSDAKEAKQPSEQSEVPGEDESQLPELPFPPLKENTDNEETTPSDDLSLEDKSVDRSNDGSSPDADETPDSPETPSAPSDADTPESPRTPASPDSPDEPDQSASESQSDDYEDLENLELQLHYGDGLTQRGSLVGND